jgi:predicted DNA-binding transcriptional regulator AlpA
VNEPLLRKEDLAARYQHQSIHTVNKWLASGTAPRSIRLGRRRYWRLEDVIAWENAHASDAESA